jgi:hypothetical protein
MCWSVPSVCIATWYSAQVIPAAPVYAS